MPRARQLKYGFFLNEQLAELPPLCRIFFEGLWLLADREGKLEDRPKKLHAQILPYDNDADIDAYLDALQNASFLRRYGIDGASYIKILNFDDHQNPHQDEKQSVIPEPVTQKHHTNTIETPEEHSINPACIPVPCIPDNKEKEIKKKKKKGKSAEFIQFYKTYPRHKDQERAWLVFQKLKPSEELFAEIMQAVENQTQEYKLKNPDDNFIFFKHPDVWLRNKCWTDEVDLSGIEKEKRKQSPYTECRHCRKEILKTLGLGGYCEKCDRIVHPNPYADKLKKAVAKAVVHA